MFFPFLQETLDLPDLKVPQDSPGLLVLKEQQEHAASRDQSVLVVLLVQLVPVEVPVKWAALVKLVLLVSCLLVPRPARSAKRGTIETLSVRPSVRPSVPL